MSNSIGDLRNSGLQGNNFPWQLKMLEGLQKIYDEVKKPLTCAEDSVNLCVPGGGLPVSIDCNDRISLCVNGAIVDATNSLPVTVVNPLPLEVNINQANDSILIYGFDGTTNQAVSVTPTGQLNVRPLTCTDVVSLCFDNGGTPTTVSDTNPLPVNAIVTVPSSLDTTIVSPLGVQADCANAVSTVLCQAQQDILTNIQNAVENTIDVNVTNTGLDIRALTCTDEVSLCHNGSTVTSGNPLPVDISSLLPNSDGVGIYGTEDGTNWNAVEVDVNGFVSTNSNIIGPLGNQDCDNSVAVSLCTAQALNLEDIKTAVEGTLDVNIVQPNLAISLGSLVVPAGVTGDLSAFGPNITSITFQNIGTAVANVSVDGGLNFFPVAPGTVINLDPRVPMGYYNGTSFYWDTTTVGASLLIIYNYI